jgi:hypothetical protein
MDLFGGCDIIYRAYYKITNNYKMEKAKLVVRLGRKAKGSFEYWMLLMDFLLYGY